MDILAHMRIQIGSHIVQTYGGNKSGCAVTAEVNTDVHDMLAYYVWCKVCQLTGRDPLANLEGFRENVALALYGDDMLKATSYETAMWFNGNTMKPFIDQLGMTITPGDKLSKDFRIKDISEVTFLKRRFLEFDEDCGEVRAPLDKSVLQRMVLWVHKSDDPIAACKANIKGALCEAFFWGPDFFKEFDERVTTACRALGDLDLYPTVSYKAVQHNWMRKLKSDLIPAQFQYRVDEGLEDPSTG